MSAGIRDLKVWQEATALAADAIRSLRAANRREIKAVVDEAMASAMAVALRVADGYSRYDVTEQHRMYTKSRRELTRLETHLGVLRQAELIPQPAYLQLGTRVQQLHRLLGGYLIYLDRQINAPARGDAARVGAVPPKGAPSATAHDPTPPALMRGGGTGAATAPPAAPSLPRPQ